MSQENTKIQDLGIIQKDGEELNTMCCTPDISGLLHLKKRIPM